MTSLERAIGASIALLLTVALASPAFACDGEKNKDDDDGESVTSTSADYLACDGEKNKDVDDGESFAA